MFRKLSIQIKIIVIISMILILSFGGVFSIILIGLYDKSINQAEVLAKEVSKSYSMQISNKLKNVEDIAKVLDSAIFNYMDSGNKQRNVIVEMQKSILKKYPDIYGITVAFEPKAYDGGNTLFIPYVTRDGHNFRVESAYNSETDMTWYNETKKLKHTFITEPTIYKVYNKSVAMTSLVLPMFNNNNKFLGVISIDYKLDTFQKLIKKLRPMGGFVQVISKKGIYIANGANSKKIMTDAKKKSKEWAAMIKQTSVGKEVKEYGISTTTGKKVLRYLCPINLEDTNINWTCCSDIPVNNMLSDFYAQFKSIIIISVISLFIMILVISVFIKYSIKGLEYAERHLDLLAQGDLTKPIDIKYTNSYDEIGKMINSIGKMQQTFKNIIKNVVEEAGNLSVAVNTIEDDINNLNSQIEDMSATAQELSAGMEETAASSEEINSSAEQIEKSAEDIAQKSGNAKADVKEIYDRADNLKKSALESQHLANSIVINVDKKIKSAIESTKAVEEINTLTESILQIATETNLISLNAAIEAMRAGEAGKGFSVVAEEIRKLAENSKCAAEKIQKISINVIGAVSNLKNSSREMLEFIENQVRADYQMQVNTGEQYTKDSSSVGELVNNFNEEAEILLEIVQNIAKVINEVALAANEGAESTTNIAQRTINASEKTDMILKQSKQLKISSDKLLGSVSRFKV